MKASRHRADLEALRADLQDLRERLHAELQAARSWVRDLEQLENELDRLATPPS